MNRDKIEEIYQMCDKYVIDNDWNELMEVANFIENLDHKDKYYQWEEYIDDDLTKEKIIRYNFEGYSVNIEGNSCWIGINFALDPHKTITSCRSDSKFKSVLTACYEFAYQFNLDKL